jgi:formylglycine-generating enzyme required for sulfatase activity/serine/threonine protein kinase
MQSDRSSDLTRRVLLDEVLDEQGELWAQGERVLAEELLARNPALRDDPAAIVDLVYHEFLLRRELGESPAPADFIERFPEQSETLERQFAVEEVMGPDGDETEFYDRDPPESPNEPAWRGRGDLLRPAHANERYRIIKRLGQGGMAVVYLARDTALDRLVALKIPHAEFERHREGIERFLREARVVAAFDHPSFCRIHDVGQINGRHFIAMAYVEGRSLATLIEPGRPFEEERAVALVLRLALAMAEAHHRGIIHRDLKPSNVMVDQRGEPIIMDFGLARRLEAEASDLTTSGALLGTPHYMAPEQVEGLRELIGPACDVYSLGVILYELLAGRRPFCGPDTRVLGLILVQEPAPLSTLRPDIDRDLESICQKTMAKKIDERYASMPALVEALETWLTKRAAASRSSPELETLRPEAIETGQHPRTGASTFSRLETLVSKRLKQRPLIGLKRRILAIAAIMLGIVAVVAWGVLKQQKSSKSDARAMSDIAGQRATDRPAHLIIGGYANSLGFEWLRVPRGRFLMGSPDGEGFENERPQHPVEISRAFALSSREVTRAQYRAVTGSDPSLNEGPDDLPVTMVSWLDAVIFCNTLSMRDHRAPYYHIMGAEETSAVTVIAIDGRGYRLPTEAEWEYACRAGSTTRYPFGDDELKLGEYAWYQQNSERKVHPVGVMKPNAWRLCDMIGNAWEWCQDGDDGGYHEHSSVSDPQGPADCEQRMIRGGSVFDTDFCRSAARQGHPQETRLDWLGFRVAVSVN